MEYVEISRFVFALVLVLGLIAGMSILLKRYGVPGAKVKTGEDARLEVMETLPLDTRNRLVLIRRDDEQHLLITGPEGMQVVETNIKPPKATAKQNAKADAA